MREGEKKKKKKKKIKEAAMFIVKKRKPIRKSDKDLLFLTYRNNEHNE